MFVVYPAIFYKNKDDDGYTVVFPDFDNGATEGENKNDAFRMAQDYIGSWLYEFFVDQKEFPKARNICDVEIEEDEYSIKADSFVSLVGLDIAEYVKATEKKVVKKTVTIPSYLNEMGKHANLNFSAILTEAIKEELNIA